MRLIDTDSIPWLVEGVGEIPVITKEEIDEMPTVDAVPVVRCKDCRRYDEKRKYCTLSASCPWEKDDFCSDAERWGRKEE